MATLETHRSPRALRFQIKSAGIVLFFLLASLYSWWGSVDDGAKRVVGNTHRGLLEDVVAKDESHDDGIRDCASVATESPLVRCEMARKYCANDSGRSLVNYLVLHFCGMGGSKWISVPVLVAILLLAFYILAETAENYFSPVVRRLVELLGMTPSMGGVTLLALGNGAPDIFASLAAIGGDNSRIGLGAILSAGTFVSAFVVGSVALAAAPFSVQPMPFVRDVSFYLGAVGLLFIVYLKGKIALWQAVGMVTFYFVFVVVVLCTDKKKEVESVFSGSTGCVVETGLESKGESKGVSEEDAVTVDIVSFKVGEPGKVGSEADDGVGKRCWDVALSPLRWLNELLPSEEGAFMGAAYYIAVNRPPASGQLLAVAVAFVMSVFWISVIAGELLGCLVTLGIILGVSPALLGLTVLAWGNSIGDLVADVAVARVGQPAMAVAGCFAGPIFNMLVGLGSALCLRTVKDFPVGYQLDHHPGILVAFGFLSLNLLGTLSVVSSSKFQLTRLWGKCLIGWYILFMVVSVVVAQMASIGSFD